MFCFSQMQYSILRLILTDERGCGLGFWLNVATRRINLLVIVLLCTMVTGQASAQEEEILAAQQAPPGVQVSAQPYPVADMNITREEITSHSFVLRFENLNLLGDGKNSSRMQTFILAGARGRVPTAHVATSEFVYIVDGQVTSSTTVVPQQIRQSFTRVNDLGQMRQFWTYTLTLAVTSPGGGEGSWVCKDAAILVDIGAPPDDANMERAERYVEKEGKDVLARAMLLNPDISPAYYTTDYNDPIDAWSAWNSKFLSAAGDMFKLKIYRGGFYRVSTADLAEVTTDSIATPATEWRLYRNGAEIPMVADPENPAEVAYFPIEQKHNDRLWTAVYWLDTSGASDSGAEPLRYATIDSPSPTWVPTKDEKQTTATFNIVHRELVDYNPRLKSDAKNDRWVWTNLSAGSPARVQLDMPPFYDPPSTATVVATVKYGFSNFPPIVPALVITLSNHYSAETTLTTQMGQVDIELPASALRPGRNEIALQLHYPPEGIQQRPVSVQSIETAWVQPLEIPQRSSYFFKPATPTTASLQFAEPLPAGVSVFQFENSVPDQLNSTGPNLLVEKAEKSLLLANVNGAVPVADVEHVTDAIDLNKLEATRAVIIAAPELLEPSMELAELQRERGLDVTVYRTDRLYDSFAYGDQGPAAIKSALRYLFAQAPGTPPEYITLVGEASEFQGDPAAVPDEAQLEMIPASTSDRPGAIQGDEAYAASIGSDMVADFVVGRIPAATASQVQDYVKKSDRYMREPAGEWARRTEFVMDDNDEFPDVVSQVVARTISPVAENNLFRQWDYEYVPNLRVPGKKRSWQATEALVKSFNKGVGIVNFFGHGGPNLWSHERLFHLSDLSLVRNSTQIPLITCASCDNAWISYPMPPVNESMGELLVLKPDGGAIGLFGPVSGASPYEHSTLVQSLMEAVLREQLRRTGDATFYAKNIYYATTRSSSIPEQYLLLGDPTVDLNMPVVEPLLSDPGNPMRAADEGPTRVSVRVADGFTFMSSGSLTLRESGTNRLLAEKHVLPRQAKWEFEMPADFEGGTVMALLEWKEDGKVRSGGTSLRVLPKLADNSGAVKRETIVGNSFDIRPSEKMPDNSANMNKLHFEIKPLDDVITSGPVQVEIYAAGSPLSSPQKVDVTTSETYSAFTVPLKLDGTYSSGPITVMAVKPPAATTMATFSVDPPPMADLEFVPGSAKVYASSGNMVAGTTIMLEATIRNVGTATAHRVTVQGLDGSPTTGTELITINDSTNEKIESLRAGEERTVTFRWEQSRAGKFSNVFLAANKNNSTPEDNRDNNSIAMPEFEVERVNNYTISKFDVSPRYVTPGTPVIVTATLVNERPSNINHPVVLEIGWDRAFDNKTTFTRKPIHLQDGISTITEKLITPAGFTHLYMTINADKEVEEENPGDNTRRTDSMMSYELPEFQKSIGLGNTLNLGLAYNATMPFEAQLQVAGDFTSTSSYLRPSLEAVTSGSAVATDEPDDNNWQVMPWRISAKAGETPGPLSLSVPHPGIHRDMPGRILGYIEPFPAGTIPLEVNLPGSDSWIRPPERGKIGQNHRLDFGVAPLESGRFDLNVRKAGNDAVMISYLEFQPQAMQWDSVPYQVPARLQNRELIFAMDTDQNQWQKVYLEYRSGNWSSDSINWEQWQPQQGAWRLPFKAAEFIQFRIIAIPKPGMQPFIENFRITK